jgi:hypothetical protein
MCSGQLRNIPVNKHKQEHDNNGGTSITYIDKHGKLKHSYRIQESVTNDEALAGRLTSE